VKRAECGHKGIGGVPAFGQQAPARFWQKPPLKNTTARTSCLLVVMSAAIATLAPGVLPGFASASYAAAIRAGMTVKEIEFRNLTRTSSAALKSLMRTQEGRPFSPEILAEDQKELFRRGYLCEEVKTEDVHGGIKLIFVMVEYPRVVNVTVKGFRKYRTKLIEASGLTVGTGASDYYLTLAKKKAEAFLAEKGYMLAIVEVESKLSEDGRIVVLHVDGGPKVQVKSLKFTGNKAFSDSELKKYMTTKVDKWWNSRIYDRETLQDDLARIRSYYIFKGYPNAEVTSRRRLHFIQREDVPEVDLEDDASIERVRELRQTGVEFTGRVDLTIEIVEGRTYTVRKVTFSGNTILDDRQLLAHIKLQPGTMFSREAVADDVKTLERLYRIDGRGRANVLVSPARTFTLEGDSVDVHFAMEEGPVFYISNIRTRGNYKTLKKVILRESDILPGDIYDIDQIDEFKRRLVNLRYFVHDKDGTEIEIVEHEAPQREGDDRHWMDLTVDVEETETGGMGLGGGAASDSGLYATLFFRQRNFDITDVPNFEEDGWAALYPGNVFTGAGQSLSLRASPGQDRSRYSAVFTEPWLFDKPCTLQTGLHKIDSIYKLYDEDRMGGRIYLGKRLTRDIEACFSYRIQTVDISDIEFGSPTEVYDVRGDNIVSALQFGVTVDKLDYRMMPSSGYEANAGVELSGGPFGGDYDILKAELAGRKYYTLKKDERGRKHVLATRGRIGTSWDYGNDDVPIFERFYAGGGGTYGLRGFEHHGVGPRGKRTYINPANPLLGTMPTWRDEPIGGRFLALTGVEYQFPLLGRSLRGVTFVDAGTVSSKPDFDAFSDIRASVGFGFRVFIPAPMFQGVPITLDFAIPLLKESSDDTEFMHFTLGITF